MGAEGIAWQANENILIADTAADFASATIHLLQDADHGQQLGQAGRRWVLQQYNWRKTYQQWDSIYTLQAHKDAVIV